MATAHSCRTGLGTKPLPAGVFALVLLLPEKRSADHHLTGPDGNVGLNFPAVAGERRKQEEEEQLRQLWSCAEQVAEHWQLTLLAVNSHLPGPFRSLVAVPYCVWWPGPRHAN